MTWASTPRGETIYGAGSLFVDIVVIALFSCFVGALLREKFYVSAMGLTLVVLCGMLYSGITFYQFGIKERVTKTEMAEKTHAAQLSADAQTQTRKDMILNRLLDEDQTQIETATSLLLAKQSNINREVAKAEIQSMRSAKATTAFANVEVKPAPVFIDPDPGARGLAADTGFSIAAVQKVLMLFLGALLIGAKPVCFALGVGMWPKAPAPTVSTQAIVARPEEEDEDDLEPDNDAVPKTDFGPSRRDVDPVIQVEMFYEEATAPSNSLAKGLQATSLHSYFEQWQKERNFWPQLTVNKFGRISTQLIRVGKLDMVRRDGQFGVMYSGRTPIYCDALELRAVEKPRLVASASA